MGNTKISCKIKAKAHNFAIGKLDNVVYFASKRGVFVLCVRISTGSHCFFVLVRPVSVLVFYGLVPLKGITIPPCLEKG